MLQEFTDTQIDFTETEEDSVHNDESMDESSAPVVKLVHLMMARRCSCEPRTFTSNRLKTEFESGTASTGFLVERDSPPRRLLGAILSRIKILPEWTSPKDDAPKTDESRSPSARKNSTFASASSRPTMASLASCDFWTKTTSRWALDSSDWGARLQALHQSH